LNRLLSPVQIIHFQFVEQDAEPAQAEPGFQEFLSLPDLSADAAEEELEFLRKLRFKTRRPTPMFYYRSLQNLRDPLHFRDSSLVHAYKRGDANNAEKGKQMASRKKAIRRWAKNTMGPNKRDN
jgi:hypothetical protein